MSAVLAITLGNSTAAAVLATDGVLGPVRRVPVGQLEELHDVLARIGKEGGAPIPIAVASVNPPALERLERLLTDLGLPPAAVARRDFPVPIGAAVKAPERVGVDRLLGALAAYRCVRDSAVGSLAHRAGAECIVVDFGTAITVNSVRGDGIFLGGAILPGLSMAARALSAGTALLPEIPLPAAAPAVGRSTEEAIAAGVIHGAAGAVTGLIDGARRVVGPGAKVVLTGGDAARVAAHLLPDCREVRPDLVLEGLLVAYREWQKQ
jgi:type III pantothenate kinase